MRKLWALLAVLALLAAAAGASGETAAAPDLYDLYEAAGSGREWICTAVPIMDGVTITSRASLPEHPEHLEIWDGSAYRTVSTILSTGDGSLLVLLHETDGEKPGIPAYPFLEAGRNLNPGSLMVRSGDWLQSRINRAVYDLSGTTWKNKAALVMTLSGGTSLGSPLVTRDGKLAGIIVAQYAEGADRYVAMTVQAIAECLQEASELLEQPQPAAAGPEGFRVTTEANLVTFNWAEMELPEAGDGEVLFLIVADSESDYLTYAPIHTGVTQMTMLLAPGRTYLCGIAPFAGIPDDLPEQFVVVPLPEAAPMAEYEFRSKVFAIAELPQDAPEGTMPVPAEQVTEALLRSGRACIYSVTGYRVDEKVEGSTLLITLTDPAGNNYRYESGWYYDPEIMDEDAWYVTLADSGLFQMLDQSGYPQGTYTMNMYIDGKFADSFTFELGR